MVHLFTSVAIIPLLGFVFYTVLFGIVALRRSKEPMHLLFLVYLATMIVWSFASFMMREEHSAGSALFWNRVMVAGSAGMPIAFFAFVRVFLRRRGRILFLAGLISYLLTQIANVTGLLITDAELIDGLLYNDYGIALPLIGTSWVFFIGYSVFDLIRATRSTKDTTYQNRIKYLLVVAILIFLGSLTNVTVLRYYPVDIAFNVICALTIAYAILRFRLLDISLVFRKGLLYSIPTVIIGASYFLVIYLVTTAFEAIAGPQIFVIALVVAVFAAVAVQPLRDRAQVLIDRLFFREKFDVRLMLQRLSDSTASILDLDTLTGMILDELSQTMHINSMAIFLREEESSRYAMVAQRGLESDKHLNLRADHTLVEWLDTNESILQHSAMEVLPQFKALWINEREELAHLGMALYIPLKAKGSMVGFVAIGPKLSEVTYSQDDELTLITLANQTAVTIENARLYRELQQTLFELRKAHEGLEVRVQERTGELAEANAALQTEIGERRNAEERIRISLEEKEVLLEEIHHRVKNNLQIISSLLDLQAQAIDDPKSKATLLDSQNRVRSMAMVHEKLYQSDDLSKIAFAEYLDSLANDLLRSYDIGSTDIRLFVEAEEAHFDVNTVIPFGLIINELISNSLKYAFIGRETGEIRIYLTATNVGYMLRFEDNGVGIAEDFDFRSSSSLGMQLVTTLVNQMEGTIELESDNGTRYIICFPEGKE